jgi:hypothetical protein
MDIFYKFWINGYIFLLNVLCFGFLILYIMVDIFYLILFEILVRNCWICRFEWLSLYNQASVVGSVSTALNLFMHLEMQFKQHKIVISSRFMLSDSNEKDQNLEHLDRYPNNLVKTWNFCQLSLNCFRF